jgi:hypothetical protein
MATSEMMRTFCLEEAEKCDKAVRRSLSTPVFRSAEHATDKSPFGGTPAEMGRALATERVQGSEIEQPSRAAIA